MSPVIYHAKTFTSVFNSKHDDFFSKGTELLVVLKLSTTVFKTLHLSIYFSVCQDGNSTSPHLYSTPVSG